MQRFKDKSSNTSMAGFVYIVGSDRRTTVKRTL